MEGAVNILLIEDSIDDAALIKREFRKAEWDFDWKRVDTDSQILEELEQNHWNIIICDYQLPRLDGLTALQLVKAKDPDLPFILVSGNVGEELAVKVMKSGADDYIMKDNLNRLVPAVNRAIKDSKLKRKHREAEKRIIASEAHLKALFENTAQGFFLLGEQYQVLWLNGLARSYCKTFWKMDINRGDAIDTQTISHYLIDFEKNFNQAFQGNKVEIDQEIYVEKDAKGWLNIQYLPINYEDGNILGVCILITDISARKENELELKKTNDRLKEFAFFTSHNLRKPLANILGLVSLLDVENFLDSDEKEIITNLKASATELDQVIHETNLFLTNKENKNG